MTYRSDLERGRDIVARWCKLAEQRLEHLTELFESGRWRRYHSEAAFLENIQEAKTAVETWRNLLSREASLDNSAIDMSWLGRARTTLPQVDGWRQPRPQPQLRAVPVEKPRESVPPVADVLVALAGVPSASADAPAAAAPPAVNEMPLPVLDLVAMQKRYPLLRNAL
jgi:uncharacterized repeat protein (TIGR03809 family)